MRSIAASCLKKTKQKKRATDFVIIVNSVRMGQERYWSQKGALPRCAYLQPVFWWWASLVDPQLKLHLNILCNKILDKGGKIPIKIMEKMTNLWADPIVSVCFERDVLMFCAKQNNRSFFQREECEFGFVCCCCCCFHRKCCTYFCVCIPSTNPSCKVKTEKLSSAGASTFVLCSLLKLSNLTDKKIYQNVYFTETYRLSYE